MKSYITIVSLLLLFCLSSCKKEEQVSAKNSFVQTFTCDTDFAAVGSLILDDGNYLVVSADQKNYGDNRIPGHMIKLDAKGKIIWNKRVSEKNRTLFKVITIPGTGYATLGWDSPMDSWCFICIYDRDGNLLSENKVNSGGSNTWMAPCDFIYLSNGNFVFASSDQFNNNVGYLKILDPSFHIIHSKTFSEPAGYTNVWLHGICEQADGNLAIMGTTVNSNNSLQSNMILIRTTPDATQLSFNFMEDLNLYETTNALVPIGNGSLAVTSSITYGQPGGTYVNYTNNNNGLQPMISGVINVVQFDSAGNFSVRKIITDYPANGMMNSLRATEDGGFIFCGTVNQAFSPVIVSYTKIFLVKLDANLDVQWSRIINTTYPAYGIDAFEASDGGYLVTGYQKSFNTRYEMMVIKTDANGNF